MVLLKKGYEVRKRKSERCRVLLIDGCLIFVVVSITECPQTQNFVEEEQEGGGRGIK